jgi:hypothetical protein
VLDELRRAKLAGERHLHCDHIVPIDGTIRGAWTSTTCRRSVTRATGARR